MFYIWNKTTTTLAAHSKNSLTCIDKEVSVSFRSSLLDCDGLRLMNGFQYLMYMYLSGWTLYTRARFPNISTILLILHLILNQEQNKRARSGL